MKPGVMKKDQTKKMIVITLCSKWSLDLCLFSFSFLSHKLDYYALLLARCLVQGRHCGSWVKPRRSPETSRDLSTATQHSRGRKRLPEACPPPGAEWTTKGLSPCRRGRCPLPCHCRHLEACLPPHLVAWTKEVTGAGDTTMYKCVVDVYVYGYPVARVCVSYYL